MTEKIMKSFSGEPMKADAEKDIALINRFSLRELHPEEVYAFSVNLCDSQTDRDMEAFSVDALHKLAKLFLGKPLIQDHEWSANNQQGRIYRCQVVQDGSIHRLRASIYMMRTPGTEETISQIEGGILREVSVGCSCKKMRCSICGEEMERRLWGPTKCKNEHEKGQIYNGKTCVGILEEPTDAYEVSFVAVPSQREAGVTKSQETGRNTLSPEEKEFRKKILLENEKVIAAFSDRKQNEKKDYPDIVPLDKYSPDSIKFVMIPSDVVSADVMKGVLEALGFCRKELGLQVTSVRWFASADDAENLGLDISDFKAFHQNPALGGLASHKNPTQILIRYPLRIEDTQKAVFHECWHTFQMKDERNPCMEENAYWYQDDAYDRFRALSQEEKDNYYWWSYS